MHAPVALLPVLYPRETFLKAKQATEVFNLMIDRVAQDDGYLLQTLAAAAVYDDFTVRAAPQCWCQARSLPQQEKVTVPSVLLAPLPLHPFHTATSIPPPFRPGYSRCLKKRRLCVRPSRAASAC